MKMINRDEVIAVIQAEQFLIKDRYVGLECASPGHCAIGALLHAAGVDDTRLGDSFGHPSEWKVGGTTDALMRSTYGLRRLHALQILQANDAMNAKDRDDADGAVESRRARVIARVISLAAQQTEDPAANETACDDYDAPDTDNSYEWADVKAPKGYTV